MARPSKYDEYVKPKLAMVKNWARDGYTDKQIAERLNIKVSTFYAYKKEFSEFSESLKEGKDEIDYLVENALLKNALSGNITAQIFWLKNRRPATCYHAGSG